jgi:polysaccharide biosynthesis transport protein
MALIGRTSDKPVYQPRTASREFTVVSPDEGARYAVGAGGSAAVVDFLQQVIAAKWLLLAAIILCTAVGIGLGFIQTRLYRAQTSLEIQDMNDKFMDAKQSDPNDTSNYTAESYLQTQLRIVSSRTLIERALARLTEADKQHLLVPSLISHKLPSGEQFIKDLTKNLTARPSRQARIIDISFDSPDAQAGANFVNALAQELADYSLERRWKSSQRTREWLERQLGDFRRNLEKSEKELQDYAHTSGLLFTAGTDNVAEAKLLEIQDELSRAQADRMTKQANYERVSQSDPDSLTEVVNDSTLRELHVRLADIQRQLSELQSVYTPQHQSVVKMRAQANEMQSIFDKRRASIVRQIKNEFDAAAARERLVQQNFDKQRGLVSGLSEKEVHYSILKRGVEANRQLYDSMMTRMKEAGVASAIRSTNILVIDPAIPEKKPFAPSLPSYAAAGALCGSLIGILYILFREHASSTFATPGLSGSYLGLPELAAIPTDDYLRQLTVFSPGDAHPTLQLAFDKRSASAESYRALRASLLNHSTDSQPIRSLVFTSAAQGDGKSTVVSNLGAAMASTERRVLLIDADLRKPRLHELLGVKNHRGLIDLLRFDSTFDAFVNPHFILETAIPGLSLLPAGIPAPDGPELLATGRLRALIRELTESYDMILIDSPPVIPFSDARNLGRAANGIVLIVRAETSDRRAVSIARDQIALDQIPLLGTILTDWNAKKYMFEYYRSGRKSSWTL